MSSNVGKALNSWLAKQKPKEFPGKGKTDYAAQFATVADFLNKHVHSEVEKGAAVRDPDGEMFLNNHGPEHIETVISRASDILNAAECTLSPYEAYLFLFAAHLHDTGNLYGREKHEQQCREIMRFLGSRAGDDELEKRWIVQIAVAHGGELDDGEKDTISHFVPEATIQLLGKEVRIQFLAALLRLADELADDRSRAARFALTAGAIPARSVLYHQYSQSLHSVAITQREVNLEFDLSESTATQTFLGKSGTQVFLLDEIFNRTMKMHTERMYCMRFLRPRIRLDEVRVNIEVFAERYTQRLEQIRYRLIERGYPGRPGGGIQQLCPELKDWSGNILKDKLTRPGEVTNAIGH